jgi:peptidoglycan-associated lipoprotein
LSRTSRGDVETYSLKVLEMKIPLRVGAASAVLFLSVIGAACHHHHKRPPVAVATPPPGGADQETRRPRTEPLDNGRDVQPIGNEGLNGRDIVADSGEGGPLADVRFDLDSAALTPAAQQLLSAHASWLKDSRRAVVLEGHCDERGTVEYNLALGEQRARAVYDYLTNLGVPAARMKTVSLGKERPFDTGHSEEAWAKNRRVHFAVADSR